jgi:hypothetical protein
MKSEKVVPLRRSTEKIILPADLSKLSERDLNIAYSQTLFESLYLDQVLQELKDVNTVIGFVRRKSFQRNNGVELEIARHNSTTDLGNIILEFEKRVVKKPDNKFPLSALLTPEQIFRANKNKIAIQ